MKTHELANQLELLARILRSMPDTELTEASGEQVQHSLQLFESKTTKPTSRANKPLPKGVEESLSGKSPAEIEKFLSSEDENFSLNNLLEFAERLGISTSKRQSKSAVINLITRHFEAKQMHSIIRNTKPDDT